MKIQICLLCFLFSILGGRADEFDLGARGMLSIKVPDDWSIASKALTAPDGKPIGYAFSFKPRDNANASCKLTFAYATNGAPDKAAIRKEVLRITKRVAAGSVEKARNLKDFSLQSGYGCYCLFTDASLVGKKPKPGDFKVLATGQVQPGADLLGVVSLFADDAEGTEMTAMLKMINSLKVTPRSVK